MTYVCGRCDSVFPAGAILGGYGVFLARSEGTGRAAVVDTSTGSAFEEISRLAEGLAVSSGLSERRRGDLVQFLIGEIADRDADGSTFGVGVPPRCPVCWSNRMADWQVDEPPAFVDVDLPSLSYERWGHLSADEKLRELGAAAGDFLSF
jgi:hypothetical protein